MVKTLAPYKGFSSIRNRIIKEGMAIVTNTSIGRKVQINSSISACLWAGEKVGAYVSPTKTLITTIKIKKRIAKAWS